MQRHTTLFLGLTLVTVPTILYGGLTVLGLVTGGLAGAPAPLGLTAAQIGLYRAGHAHAGVLVLLSLILQMAVERAVLSDGMCLAVRIAAPTAAVLLSAGFFALAHTPSGRLVLYAGAASLAFAVLASGIGLIRAGTRGLLEPHGAGSGV